MGNKPVKFNIVLNVANNKWSIWNITGSKIYFVMQITKKNFMLACHLNTVYCPSGLRIISLILSVTREGTGSRLSRPTTPQHHLTSCLFAVCR